MVKVQLALWSVHWQTIVAQCKPLEIIGFRVQWCCCSLFWKSDEAKALAAALKLHHKLLLLNFFFFFLKERNGSNSNQYDCSLLLLPCCTQFCHLWWKLTRNISAPPWIQVKQKVESTGRSCSLGKYLCSSGENRQPESSAEKSSDLLVICPG